MYNIIKTERGKLNIFTAPLFLKKKKKSIAMREK